MILRGITSSRHSERGQTIPILAVFMILMFLFVGFGIDWGYAYITKARLSKAVDAACLAGMRNLKQGQSQAEAVARAAFQVNYRTTTRDANTPVVNLAFTTDANSNTTLSVNATATVKTFFIRVLPQWKTLNVSANAQSTRVKLVMTLALDRSGSMLTNNGWRQLAPAVSAFLDYFDDELDRAAMASFASNTTLDVSMRHYFKTPINNSVRNFDYQGATFAHGGLLNAQTQNGSVATGSDENILKVVVFFTDGRANTIQDDLNCPPNTKFNFGGFDDVELVGFFNPSTGREPGGQCRTNGGAPGCCSGANRFFSHAKNMNQAFKRDRVTEDAEYRSIATANDLRNEDTIVYAIGLGNDINQDFLMQVANDPRSPAFNPNLPEGEAMFAPDADALQPVFEALAAKILVRLSQ